MFQQVAAHDATDVAATKNAWAGTHATAVVGCPTPEPGHGGEAVFDVRRAAMSGGVHPGGVCGAGFFLPEQPHQDDMGDVCVVCWYCGVGLDQWAEEDVLEEEHLGNSCDWRQQSGGCRWGLFLRDQRRYTAGLRVQHARRSSRAEKHRPTTIWRDTRMRGE